MCKYPNAFSRLLLLATLAGGCGEASSTVPQGQPDGSLPQADGSLPQADASTLPTRVEPNTPATKPGMFESDLPNGQGVRRAGEASAGGLNAASTPRPSADASKGVDAQRAIVEADIIQTAGDRLYALSRVAGLTVIDIADPARMTILGRYRELHGTPFEMYLRDGVVLAMYSSWGQYVAQPDGKYSWVQTSKVIALEVANPAAITAIGSFDVPGEVSDSRIVGDVMYVVGYQNGSCWNCEQSKPRTAILSLNVKNPRQVQKVDELAFADGNNSYGWNKRSVTVTDKRMYVAGPEYGQEPKASSIQVVDISDPAGDLVAGATIAAAGQISSRWQMDEYQGVLRVISQMPTWWQEANKNPRMQTFTVASSQSVTPLASVEFTIPRNEVLNTVRFDGPRGYAITSERTDPLFTLDFSNPAQPRYVGELEMPGWIYHLVPRGDRVVGLGYDQGNPQGAITVSIFDVSNFDKPTMLDRVNFGGDWGSLPEDQDRIHKAFKILDDQGLILVPFSGWSRRQESFCWSAYRSGVQLVDLNGDDLVLRGAAPSRGQARRALIHNQKLLTVSDEAVDTYDISNRDQPTEAARLTIARYVSRALPLANNTVARINEDWYGTQNSTIDFVANGDIERAEVSLAELNLSQVLSATDDSCQAHTWIESAFSRENQLVISYQRYNYAGRGDVKIEPTQTRGIITIDASDAAKPRVAGKLETTEALRGSHWYRFDNYYRYGYTPTQQNAVLTGQALVFLEQRYVSNNSTKVTYDTRLRVVDLRNPAEPRESTLMLPSADGYAGLVGDGNNVMLSHYDLTSAGRARFYVDRIDLADPAAPKIAGQVNVPGSLLHYDRAHERMLTSELLRTVVGDVTSKQCYERFAHAQFQYASTQKVDENTLGTCTGYRERLHLVHFVPEGAALEESYELGERDRLSSSSMGDGRVVAIVSRGYQGWWGHVVADCFGPCGYGYAAASEPMQVLTVDGFASGDLRVGRLTVENLTEPWWGFWGSPPVYAFGARALIQSQTDALVLDLTDVTAPTVLRKVPLYASPVHVVGFGSSVLMALGMNGVQRVDL